MLATPGASPRWDVIVVGARIAGATLAALLGRAGLRVLLVDRRAVAGAIAQQASWSEAVNRVWARVGVLDRLRALDVAPRSANVFVRGGVVDRVPLPVDRDGAHLSIRREVLDPLLLDHAAATPGVEVRADFPVDAIRVEEGRVVGVAGPHGEERGALVVGADGRHSRVARLVGAGVEAERTSGTAFYFADHVGVDTGGAFWLDVDGARSRCVGLAPADSGVTAILTTLPERDVAAFAARLDDAFDARIAEPPVIRELLRAARRVGPVLGARGLALFRRRAAGPGWALVGDAGYHLHPVTAVGTTTAVVGADLLADAIVDGGPNAFTGYGAARDAAFAEEWARAERILALLTPTPVPVAPGD